jgi:VWFA-related protein
MAQTAEQEEVTSQEKPPAFKLQVQSNLVLVRVVVRDSKGHAVGGLRKEDFKLFDNGKPQVISNFSVETPATPPAAEAQPSPPETQPESAEPPGASPITRLRYLGLFFDDLNSAFEDLARARDAAERFLTAALTPSARAGVFTSSGLNTLDFTDDLSKLRDALSKLRPNGRIHPGSECPEISDYQAEQIVYHEDPDAIAVAVDEEVRRCHGDPQGAELWVKAYAQNAYDQYEYQAHINLQNLGQLVRRMGTLPGQRNVILVSGGFLTLGLQSLVEELADRALRSNVIINSLDPRGLPVLMPEGEASRQYAPSDNLLSKIHILIFSRDFAASALLAQLAEDTGGEFFHNTNDLDAGFAKVATTPEVYYSLAFSPQNLKYDGSLHRLKVQLVNNLKLSVLARRGYFAPKKLPDAKAQVKEEVEAAAFSQDEVKELPVDVHTQYFKTENGDAQLSVLVHLDIRSLRFRQEQDRNASDLTFVTVLFDRDGKYADSKDKQVILRLRAATLEKLLATGITVTTSFAVKPGTYLIRQVVRDSEDGHLAALNSSLDIPY